MLNRSSLLRNLILIFGFSSLFFLFLFGIYPSPRWEAWQSVVSDPEEENPINSFNSSLEWMKRPTLLTRSPMNYGINFDRLMWECDQYEISTANCLRYLDNYKSNLLIKVRDDKEEIPTMIFHCFWGGEHWNNKITFLLKSFLFTQRIGRAQFWIWFKDDNTYEESKYHAETQRFKGYSEWIDGIGEEPTRDPKNTFLVFRKFRFETLSNTTGTAIDPSFFTQKGITDVALSDLARVLLLHEYGGIYFDIDNLLLRDFTDLYVTGKDFAYRWSHEEPPSVNTAVFFLNKGSQVAKEIVRKGIRMRDRWFHPRRYLRFVRGTGAKLWDLPCPVFDPLWLMNDEDKVHLPHRLYPDMEVFEEPFTNKIDPTESHDMKAFFGGAWSLHYHGQWKHDFQPWNWMGLWNSLFDCFLSKQCENLYGERFKG